MKRRVLLQAFLAAPALSLAGYGSSLAQPLPLLERTPECNDEASTPAQTEGPYFTPNTPLKRDLSGDRPGGEKITIAGYVVDERCRPIPSALLEIWHTDANGAYDNQGYDFRGHQFTDESGRWWFTTIVPGLYPGRTRHYHFKAQKKDGAVLTTQLYFPDEPLNERDWIYDRRLLMTMSGAADGRFGRFDFVL